MTKRRKMTTPCVVLISFLYVAIAQAEDRWMSIPLTATTTEAVEANTISINGISMHYAVYGESSDTPVLMIHGGLAHADWWAPQIADLANDYKIIVADTRGHGRSSNDGSKYSYELLARDYLALLDHLEIAKVHLVGWSDGANIGYSISQTDPERLASHFAHAGNVTLDGIDPTVEENALFGSYVGMMATDYANMSPAPDGFDDFLSGVVEMWGTEKTGSVNALNSVSVPTLVVHSEYDEAILLEHSNLIADAMPTADLLVLEDVSHFASRQAPDMYNAAIRAFLEQ